MASLWLKERIEKNDKHHKFAVLLYGDLVW